MRRLSSPVRGALVGTLVGGLLAVLAGANHKAPQPRTGPVVIAAFLADWRHQFEGTYVAVMRFDRTTTAGGHFTSTETIAQRPPDTFSTGPGSVEARRGDRRLACGQGPSGRLDCRDAGALPPYATVVDQRVANVATYFSGPAAVYFVNRDGPHCYRLLQGVPVKVALDLPFGSDTRVCFDPVTGAVRRRQTVRTGAVDLEVATSIKSFVTDADLAPKPGAPGSETFAASP
jgi:hypothetical protein